MKPECVKCAAHCLQLCMKDGLKISRLLGAWFLILDL